MSRSRAHAAIARCASYKARLAASTPASFEESEYPSMTSRRPPLRRSRVPTARMRTTSSRMWVARASSAPDSNRHTTSSLRGSVGSARRASVYAAATSSALRVKLITSRWQAASPSSAWIAAIARNVASTSGSGSRTAARSTSACWRTSSDARWNPNVRTCSARLASSPSARTGAPPARSDARRVCRSRSKASTAPYPAGAPARVAASRSAISTSLRRCGASGSVRASSRARSGNVRTSRASDRRSASEGGTSVSEAESDRAIRRAAVS